MTDKINACGTLETETERLILRPFTLEDAKSVNKNWAGDEYIQKMYGEPVYKTIEDTEKLLDKYIKGYESGYYYRWAVIEKDSGECIGQAAYFLIDRGNHFGEIEYCIGKAFQGKGYATEATKALIKIRLRTDRSSQGPDLRKAFKHAVQKGHREVRLHF